MTDDRRSQGRGPWARSRAAVGGGRPRPYPVVWVRQRGRITADWPTDTAGCGGPRLWRL